ncbi:PepSY domain containing protein [Desulfovibrio sp. X2]|uniref:PepSY domain-containing protein n=1 Tax=Desulfovibrio sp. X2 TaxID=941449 RepID=UPI0003588849|nr:PepSY domain-containing protein [Desulfovibrio sp. X2]EPR43091.1 PepSY domain containing protein [Desulfovibrio sp. X2]
MKRTRTLFIGLALASLVFSAAFAAARTHREENDAASVRQAKVGLTQAVAAAEQAEGGRASRAEFDKEKDGRLVYEVEVVSADTVHDVTVDALTGKVVKSSVDKIDHDDDHGEHEDGE